MQEGQKVRMVKVYYDFMKGDIVTCVEIQEDGNHYFVNKEGDNLFLLPSHYEIINETMTRQELEKAARDIQAQIEALPKNELEIGKWYKYNNSILNYQGVNEGILMAYGIVRNTSWYNLDKFGTNPEEWVLLTESEHKTILEPALIAEAKKIGFKEGVKINSLECVNCSSHINEFIDLYDSKHYWFSNNDNEFGMGNKCLFKEGKWATIIEEPKVFIGGYEMKQKHQKVMFGCMEFSKSNIKALYANCKRLNISEVTIKEGCSNYHITLDQLSEIVKNIED
jgi:hypothetical protein